MPKRGQCRATGGISTRSTSDIPGPPRKDPSNDQRDEKAYKNEVRNDHLRLEEHGDDNLPLQDDFGKVFGQRDLTLQNYEGLVDLSNPNSPSLGSQRHENRFRMVSLRKRCNLQKRVEVASRSTLGLRAFRSERLRTCGYILDTNVAKNTPVRGALQMRAITTGGESENGGWVAI